MTVAVFRVILAAIVFAGAAHAQDVNSTGPGAAIEDVQKAFDSTRAMKASFSQTITSKGFGQDRAGEGVMWLQKPAKMRWEYSNPPGLVIVADGERLWYLDKEENSLYTEPLSGILNQSSPLMFLAGEAPLEETFRVSVIPGSANDRGDVLKLKLLPVDPQPGLKGILLKVDSKTYNIKEILMVDHLGNRNSISFSEVEISAFLDPAIFGFTPPEGVQIQPSIKGFGP